MKIKPATIGHILIAPFVIILLAVVGYGYGMFWFEAWKIGWFAVVALTVCHCFAAGVFILCWDVNR